MHLKNPSRAHDPMPGTLAATKRTPRTLGALYREYRSECLVALAVVSAAALIALSQSRGEPRQVEPRAVSVGGHWQQ
jgi:hypothetical protein